MSKWSIRFYQHSYFSGKSFEVPGMTPGELHKTGYIQDAAVGKQVTSFKIQFGYRVWVYSGEHQDGVGWAYDGDVGLLTPDTPPGNDAIQSFKVERLGLFSSLSLNSGEWNVSPFNLTTPHRFSVEWGRYGLAGQYITAEVQGANGNFQQTLSSDERGLLILPVGDRLILSRSGDGLPATDVWVNAVPV
jgi:hypothetical protein